MTVLSWITDEAHQILGLLSAEEKALATYFAPLFQQIEAAALQLGKEDLQAGLKVLFDAATSAAVSAATATGDKVVAAETAFVGTVASEGITAVHNAEAGLIKAAAAAVQTAKSLVLDGASTQSAEPVTTADTSATGATPVAG